MPPASSRDACDGASTGGIAAKPDARFRVGDAPLTIFGRRRRQCLFGQLTTVSAPIPLGVRNPPRNTMITTLPPRGENSAMTTDIGTMTEPIL